MIRSYKKLKSFSLFFMLKIHETSSYLAGFGKAEPVCKLFF